MGKIYKNQTALTLTFNLNADITGYVSVVANVLCPDKTQQYWTCTVSNPVTGVCTFSNFTSTNFSQAGDYFVQPQVNFSATSLMGETEILKVNNAWE
jgi:hypothetical protein